MSKSTRAQKFTKNIILIGIMIPSIFLINQILTNHVTSAVNSAQSVQTADLTPLFLLIGIIGGCITLTLSYVSWLKYKAEKRIRKKEHK